MSPNLSRWLLATLVFVALGFVVSRAGLSTARWIMLGLLMLVFFFGGTSARRSPDSGEPDAQTNTDQAEESSEDDSRAAS
jgi:hypothetical protein